MLRVKINGEKRIINSDVTVTKLLKELELDPLRVAIEVNLGIINKSSYDMTKINNGDNIEIIHLIGGG